MTETRIQRAFRPVKTALPRWLWQPIRRVATAAMTPAYFSLRSGHFLSSLKARAVTRRGEPLPWYTYPAIEFLRHRDFAGRTVLEFGAGQSTLWWAARAARVVALEGDASWMRALEAKAPPNVELRPVRTDTEELAAKDVEEALAAVGIASYDVVVIDGFHRFAMIPIAAKYRAPGGILVCDDSEGYNFRSGLKDSGLSRVDFFGHQPGVILPHATSIYFGPECFAFDARHPLPDIGLVE